VFLIKITEYMSLKIIKIDTLSEFLTVDNTNISVDNTNISVDATLIGPVTYLLKIPYRFFTNEIILNLWSEIKQVETIYELTVTQEDGLMVLEFFHEFIDNETFEVRVTDLTDKLIWRGKIMATTQTNLEDYILHKVVDNNIIKI
jgi:hypothetical protein